MVSQLRVSIVLVSALISGSAVALAVPAAEARTKVAAPTNFKLSVTRGARPGTVTFTVTPTRTSGSRAPLG